MLELTPNQPSVHQPYSGVQKYESKWFKVLERGAIQFQAMEPKFHHYQPPLGPSFNTYNLVVIDKATRTKRKILLNDV